ncbi:MAG: hypothetical protein HONBIEJF_02836 [Fimbriimonadaceae bacterium]|nr:hypothetical protein [Fimbriimonadaceae bacterium]
MRIFSWAVVATVLGGALVVDMQKPTERAVGVYETRLDGRMANQRHNALLALRKLDGKVVEPGAIFSFNSAVGSCTRDQGYRKAPVSYNGQLIPSWGGGVCQTSTTLYNAALLSGMEIVERWPHRFAPNYVSPGRDAAVAYTSYDLRFRNTLSKPVTVRAEHRAGSLRISLLSADVPQTTVRCESRIVSRQMPRTFEFGGKPTGRQRVRNSGKPGYDVVVYRETDGKRELISVDSYPEMNRIVDFR